MTLLHVSAPRSAEEIAREWAHFLPPGSAWQGENLRALIRAMALPVETLERDIAGTVSEITPGLSDRFLADYHTVLGENPYGINEDDLSRDQLRDLLQQRWTLRGDQRPAFYIALARYFGVEITIEEPVAPCCGVTECGTREMATATISYDWIVEVPEAPRVAVCGATVCGLPVMGQFEPNPYEQLIALFRKIRPAATRVFFRKNGVWING